MDVLRAHPARRQHASHQADGVAAGARSCRPRLGVQAEHLADAERDDRDRRCVQLSQRGVDLAKYRSQYGLPPCTKANGCLKIVNQNGQASPLPGNAPPGDDWTVEAALDLDMASAACPNCKLLLVEANDDQSDGLFIAQNAAAQLGATVISNSWGGPEDRVRSSYETYFNHSGVGIFVAAGDAGYNDGGQGPDYPSTSAYVTGVGGTSLVKASNTRGLDRGCVVERRQLVQHAHRQAELPVEHRVQQAHDLRCLGRR